MTLDYHNIKTDVNVYTGGWTSVTITSNAGQGADIPCRFCRLQSRDGNATIRVRMGAECTVSTGITLPSFPTITPYPISNLNLLYFYGATNDNVVDVEYFR
jgi:hypothetical protein